VLISAVGVKISPPRHPARIKIDGNNGVRPQNWNIPVLRSDPVLYCMADGPVDNGAALIA